MRGVLCIAKHLNLFVFSANVREFHEELLKQCSNFGMFVKRAKTLQLDNDKTENYISKIRSLPDNVQLVVAVFIGPQRADKYSAVKKLCCLEKPVASQVILQKTLSNSKRLKAVVQKIALQINCKLGGQRREIVMRIQRLENKANFNLNQTPTLFGMV